MHLESTPNLLCSENEFNQIEGLNNFTKGVFFSPDGTCLLSSSEDCVVRIYEVPDQPSKDASSAEWEPCLRCKEGETVYDVDWFPGMSSQDPATCVFLATSRDHPLHLWDAYTGQIRASYRAYDHLDEITSAISLAFNPDGSKIFAGYNRMIRVFDTTSPGRSFESRPTSKTRKSRIGQRGIISALAFSPDGSGLYAAGSYAATIGLYDERTRGETYGLLTGSEGGITHLKFSQDGNLLFSGGRKDPCINVWDVRNTGQVLAMLKREVLTNQRVYFDIDPTGKFLATGSTDGRIIFYDTGTFEEADGSTQEKDAVNGVSFHPFTQWIAISTGQRHFFEEDYVSDDDEAHSRLPHPTFLEPLSTKKPLVQHNVVAIKETSILPSLLCGTKGNSNDFQHYISDQSSSKHDNSTNSPIEDDRLADNQVIQNPSPLQQSNPSADCIEEKMSCLSPPTPKPTNQIEKISHLKGIQLEGKECEMIGNVEVTSCPEKHSRQECSVPDNNEFQLHISETIDRVKEHPHETPQPESSSGNPPSIQQQTVKHQVNDEMKLSSRSLAHQEKGIRLSQKHDSISSDSNIHKRNYARGTGYFLKQMREAGDIRSQDFCLSSQEGTIDEAKIVDQFSIPISERKVQKRKIIEPITIKNQKRSSNLGENFDAKCKDHMGGKS